MDLPDRGYRLIRYQKKESLRRLNVIMFERNFFESIPFGIYLLLGVILYNPYFLPKSAGISPHCLVSHFNIGVEYLFSLSHFSARSINPNNFSVSAVRESFVLHFFCFTQLIAFALSL